MTAVFCNDSRVEIRPQRKMTSDLLAQAAALYDSDHTLEEVSLCSIWKPALSARHSNERASSFVRQQQTAGADCLPVEQSFEVSTLLDLTGCHRDECLGEPLQIWLWSPHATSRLAVS
jgi:hypothetical protein